MSEDNAFKDGDIVWVKLGNNWWPGEVTDVHRQPDDLLKQLRKKPYCVVKFFQEDAYEYIKSAKQIFPFQCSKKDEFIKKGTALYNAKNKFMEKFPSDVEIAERLTRKAIDSDLLIINDRPDSIVKAILGPTFTRRSNDYYDNEYIHSSTNDYNNKRRSGDSVTKILNITPKRTTTTTITTNRTPDIGKSLASPHITSSFVTNSTPSSAETNFYRCNLCDFSSQRQNVMILHRRTHSCTGTPTSAQTPSTSNARKIPSATITSESESKSYIAAMTWKLQSPATSSKCEPNSLSEDDDQKYSAILDTRTFHIAKSTKSEILSPVNSRNVSGTKHKPYPLAGSERASRSAAASTSREKSYTSLRIDADVKEITLPDGMPVSSIKGELKLSIEDDTTDNSSSHTTEDLLRSCSPRKRNIDSGEIMDNKSTMLKSTAEEMRLRLLADWSDGEKEDELVDDVKLNSNLEMPSKMETPQYKLDKLTTTSTTEVKSENSSFDLATRICATINNFGAQTSNQTQHQNRIRNIPKKDRRDAVLKEFINDYTVELPTVVENMENINCNSSSSSDSVVVVGVVPPNSGETIILDDNTGTDGETESTVGKDGLVRNEASKNNIQFNYITIDKINVARVVQEEHLSEEHLEESNIETEVQVPMECTDISANQEQVSELEDRQNEEFQSEQQENAETLTLVSNETGELEFETTEENVQSEPRQEIKNLKSESENVKQPKQKSRGKGQKSNKRQKNPKEILKDSFENTTANKMVEELPNVHTAHEIVAELTPVSPQCLKEEEQPQTSAPVNPRTDCFDFQDEEDDTSSDALKSIADFKKKYLSPEKGQDKSQTDNSILPENERRLSSEQRDQQLADDIEKLLEQTTAPNIAEEGCLAVVSPTQSFGSTKEELPVKGLPIKERGKRIFKSRNRSRIEDPPTSTADSLEIVLSGQAIATVTKMDENGMVTVTEQLQLEEKNKFSEKVESEIKAKQQKQSASIDGVDEYENAYQSAAFTAPALEMNDVKTNDFQVMEQDKENEGNVEIVRLDSVEETTILKVKNLKNGSLATPNTTIEVLHCASLEQKKSTIIENNETNLCPTETQIYNPDDLQFSKQNIEDTEQKNGCETENLEPIKEDNVKEPQNFSPHEKLEDELKTLKEHNNTADNAASLEGIQETCDEPTRAVEQESLKEKFKSNATTGREMINEDFSNDLKILPPTTALPNIQNEIILIDTYTAVDKEQSVVAVIEQQTNNGDKQLEQETENCLVVNMKNDVVEEQQQCIMLLGEEVPQSRLTSPTDDNSSICISEAGAEFGSPTSMLDDERLPTLTDRLMTPTDGLVETIPTRTEESKILVEQEMNVEGEHENVSDRQNKKIESIDKVLVPLIEGKEVAITKIQKILGEVVEDIVRKSEMNENETHTAVEECDGNAKDENTSFIATSVPKNMESELEEEELLKEKNQNNRETSDVNNSLIEHSKISENNKNDKSNFLECNDNVVNTPRSGTDEIHLKCVEIRKPEIQNQTEIVKELTCEVPFETQQKETETGDIVNNVIEEHNEENENHLSKEEDNIVENKLIEEQLQIENGAKQEGDKTLSTDFLNNEVSNEALAKDFEHAQHEYSDADDDFIESPPHEPLSGHEGEGDTEKSAPKPKLLNKTHKRRANATQDKLNIQVEAKVDPNKSVTSNSVNNSTKSFSEFTKDKTSRKRQARSAKQRQERSNDFMKELDLSDLNEKNNTTLCQNQRKAMKVAKLAEKETETYTRNDDVVVAGEPKDAVADQIGVDNLNITTSQIQNEKSEPKLIVLSTDTCGNPQPHEQVIELPTGQAAVNFTPTVKFGCSRKRRSATKPAPRRNVVAVQNLVIQENDLNNEEEGVQRVKSRNVENPNINNTSIENMQTDEEIKTTPNEITNYEDENKSNYLEEVEGSEQTVECNDNEPADSLIIEDDQCIIEEVYLNDTVSVQQIAIEESPDNDTTKDENTSESTASELNSFPSIDEQNAVEYVNYSSIEHQQPIEEVIVGAANTVEAATGIDSLQNMDESPNIGNEMLNKRLVSPINPHSKADNTCINISPMEKVRINVDVANPLSTQIANILATKSAAGATLTAAAAKQRKSNLEESIPSFIIERPGQGVGSHKQQQQHASSSGLEFIGEQDAVAHVQQMCPQVKITRKEKLIEVAQTAALVQQEQVGAASGAMFDISNMPIVLGNEHFMSAQGDMQIVLTSSAETEQHLGSDGPQILQQQIIQPAYRSTQQTSQQRQRKRSTSQQQQQQLQQTSSVGANKHGIILIKAAPSDLIIQQTPSVQVTHAQSQAVAGGATQQFSTSSSDTMTTYNLGSGVTLRPIAEPKQKQQQRQQQQLQQQKQQLTGNKSKPTASSSTGGRKHAGNTITLPSSITVKHRQQKITEDPSNAVGSATTANAVLNEQPPQLTPSTNASSGCKAQKRNYPTNSKRSQTQSQIVHQRRLTATASNLVELQQQNLQQSTSDDCASLNRRLSHSDGHAPPPAKISRSPAAGTSTLDNHNEPTFAATAEQQLLQLQQQQLQHAVQSPTATQPPPLHPLHNRKQRHSSQHNRRMSTKTELSAQMCLQEQQQQQQQRLQSTQMVLLDQQQQQSLEHQHQEQHLTAVHIAELASASPSTEIIPAEFEAIQMQEQVPEVYTEEILAEEFEANEHTPSVIAVPAQSVPGYPDTLLLCRKVGEEWVPIVAQPYYYTRCDQQLRPIPKEVLIGHPILTPNADKTPDFHTAEVDTEDVQTAPANEAYKGETGVTILIGSELVHMEWDQFLEVMRSTDDLFDLRDHLGRVFQLTRDALDTLQQDVNLQEKFRQLQQLLEEQQLEEQQQLEQQELLQQQFIQQLQTVTVAGDEGLETDIIPLLQIDTSQTLQLIGTDDGSLILQSALTQPPLSPPCTRPALTNATNALLNQTPIMSPLEKPSTAANTALIAENSGQHIDLSSATTADHLGAGGFIASDSGSGMPSLGDSLAVIGVVPTQPTLLPTTVTNPAIAPPKSDLIPNMTTAAQMHAQYRHAQRAIYNDPGS
ncbi:titin homolog [Bactrocera oleae]|uniref:titin homolog n=1 Tax=Bactrocera oleae TaxID=104688 RepID=UPI00387EE1ED